MQEGKVEVIANEEGGSSSDIRCHETQLTRLDRQIPTVLSYIDGEEYHGTQAKAQLIRNPQNTVAYFRDYLGKE